MKIFSLKRLIVNLPQFHNDDDDEEVDRQRALDDVLMYTRLVTNLKFAECDARKALRVGPVLAADQTVNDVNSVQVEIGTKESIEQEDLSDGVGQVHHLDGQISGNEVVTVEAAADEAANLGDEVLDTDHAAGLVFALGEQVAVHLVDDVADGFLADLEVGRAAADARRVHDGRQVDAGALVEEAPQQRRNGGQHRLEQKYERNPLVVADERGAALCFHLPDDHRRPTSDPAAAGDA